jgi:hypothetical protein
VGSLLAFFVWHSIKTTTIIIKYRYSL